MQRYTITSDTLTQGRITKKIDADSYPDALLTMDNIVDELDGTLPALQDPPLTLTFDELLSGRYGYANYGERGTRWQYLLPSGWFYSGNIGEATGTRCGPLARLDPNYF